jgi:1-acyl-sn-glycerol-3-phosphate acyltransferase
MALRRPARAAVVALYALAFWALLPWALWVAARRLDRAAGWGTHPSWLGWPLAACGAAMVLAAMRELWRHGRGLPVSALPPATLVTAGPYGVVRHPIYAGYNVGVFGAGLAFGSPSLAWVISPVFLGLWLAYAAVEEHWLLGRFGDAYDQYRRDVGLFPRQAVLGAVRLLMYLQVFPTRVESGENIPRQGGVVLVGNHTCYLDGVYMAIATRRPVRVLVTAEAFRKGLVGWLLKELRAIPVRRYRREPAARAEMLRVLGEGGLVGVFPEGERAPLGGRQRSQPGSAHNLARLLYPVIPVGISGAYDVGPRWADVLRRRPVVIRVGRPIEWSAEREPSAHVDAALAALLDRDPQPVHLDGLDRRRLALVLWRCPRCLDGERWSATDLACAACGARWWATPDGLFCDGAGRAVTLAELAAPVWTAEERLPMRAMARGFRERSMFGPLEPLESLGEGALEVGCDGLRFGELFLPLDAVRVCDTERCDTLQVATADQMWQFRLREGSAFRLQLAVERRRAAGRVAAEARA